MDSLGNKEIFSRNLRALMKRFGKDRNRVCDDLGFKYSTFNDWYNGKKYPRIDKIELLANYFGILKSDLIEDKTCIPSSNLEFLSSALDQLNDDGQKKLVDYADDLVSSGKYARPKSKEATG